MLKPLAAGRWGFETAAHLLNRAGFGGTPAEVEELAARGLDGAVDWLVEYGRVEEVRTVPEWVRGGPERVERMKEYGEATEEERRELRRKAQATQRTRVLEVRSSWLERMRTTRRPLEEKLVLFWHGHFATSIQKVKDAGLMYRQLEMFRKHAGGRWEDLLLAVTRDPAMLIWLDQAQSRREHPNENYAREVMELFALGEGHYTEKDVQEAARALTGLTLDRIAMEPQWRPRQHDAGVKTVLGRTGALGPEDVIARIARHPQSARHVAGRLWAFFAQDGPGPELVSALAEGFRGEGGRFPPLLRAMFRAEAFYAPGVVRTQIKSPVQWLVAALRQLGRPLPGPEVTNSALRDLGQELLAPPNVKGWDGGVAWINTGTLTRRRQLAALLVEGREGLPALAPEGERRVRLQQRLARNPRPPGAPGGGVDVTRLFGEEEREDRARLEAALARRFLQAPFREVLAEDVRAALGDDRRPDPRAIREAVRVVLQSTDYQLT